MKLYIRDYGHFVQDGKPYRHYWVYADDADLYEFRAWCRGNLNLDSKVYHRYNGGCPMVEVMIFNESDQALFKLRWSDAQNSLDA